MSVGQALTAILKTTGLTYKVVNDRTIAVVAPGAGPVPGPSAARGLAASVHSAASGEAGGEEDKNSLWNRFRVAQADQGTSSGAAPVETEKKGDQTSEKNNEALQKIIVTAQKRAERQQDVPASISVLSGSQLEDLGAVQLSDYAKQVPGLTLVASGGPGLGQVVLRGISAGLGSHPLVGIYLDDVPFTPRSGNSNTAIFSFDPDLTDIERIEVFAGPQSTLYGASSMGGVLKFVTKQPDLSDFAGSGRIDGSGVDGAGAGYGVRGSVNFPIVAGELGLRSSAGSCSRPGS